MEKEMLFHDRGSAPEGAELGVVLPPIGREELRVLAYGLEPYAGNGVEGTLLRVALPGGGLLVTQVLAYEVLNDLGEHLALAEEMGRLEGEPRLSGLLRRETHLVLRCRVLSGFRRRAEAWERLHPLPVVPPFAKVYPLEEEDLGRIMPLREAGGRFFSLGRYYGSEVRHRLHLQDFNSMDEAYHFAVVGLPGTGKSTLVKMLLAAYGAIPQMSFVVVDTVGEFSAAFLGKDGDKPGLRVPLGEIFQSYRRPVEVLGLKDLALSTWEMVEVLLTENHVFRHLGIRKPENERLAAEYLVNQLRERGVRLADLPELPQRTIEEILQDHPFADYVYKGSEPRRELRQAASHIPKEFWQELREKVFSHYSRQKQTVHGLVKRVLEPGLMGWGVGHTTVINLGSLDWGPVKYLLLHQLFATLERQAMDAYRERGRAVANTLVVVEEAHRMVPPKEWVEEGSYEERVRNTLRRAVTETRKAGLGWLFISTRIANLDRTIFEESRVRIVGRGLSVGADAERIREAFGSEVLSAYRELPDPVDPFNARREHAFLVSGPLGILSRGTPEIVSVYEDYAQFVRANGLKGRP